MRFTLVGLLVGGALGATPRIAPLVSHVHSWVPHRFAYAAIVFGVAAGGYLGFLIGQSRAVALRLQASMAVHQVELGRMLYRAEALRLPLPAAASLPAPAPAPDPSPVAPPAPAPVTSLPARPPVAPALPPIAPAPAPLPAALQPAPVPQLTAVPPVFEWPQPSQPSRDATGS
jgi:hypothetical protein